MNTCHGGFIGTLVLLTILLGLIVIGGGAYYVKQQNTGSPDKEATETQSTPAQTQSPTQEPTQTVPKLTEARATGVYVLSLRLNSIAGGAATDGKTDIYIFGPNNGNPADVAGSGGGPSGPGPLAFRKLNVPVVNGRWSIPIAPPLTSGSGADYYLVNADNHLASQGLAGFDGGGRGDLLKVNVGPACGAQPSAIFDQSTVDFAASEKTLTYGFDGYACNVTTVAVVVSNASGEVWSGGADVLNGQWTAEPIGQGPKLTTPGIYTVKVTDSRDNGTLVTQTFVVK
jgi:hypothetical protein